MYIQTIYQSRITGDFGALTLLALQKACVKYNRDHGITGFLYHDAERILHVLEGKPDMVAQAMDRIRNSRLHTDIKVRSTLHCDHHDFPHWYFGTTSARDPYFQRVTRALNTPAFFSLDAIEALQILKKVASKKRRAVKFDQYRQKLHHFNKTRPPGTVFASP